MFFFESAAVVTDTYTLFYHGDDVQSEPTDAYVSQRSLVVHMFVFLPSLLSEGCDL